MCCLRAQVPNAARSPATAFITAPAASWLNNFSLEWCTHCERQDALRSHLLCFFMTGILLSSYHTACRAWESEALTGMWVHMRAGARAAALGPGRAAG
jgi:hypothetical protein